MPINHKRRIFRPDRPPDFHLGLGLGWPSPRLAVTILACVAVLGAGLWAALRPSEAPAFSVPIDHITASPAQVAVLDGRTLRLRTRVVALAGLVVPERGVTCTSQQGKPFDCGVAAANALADLVRDAEVDCTLRGADAAGRPLGECTAHGVALNQALVAAGWARAEPGMQSLLAAEDQARSRHHGIWGNGAVANW